jgi:competence protein ComEA
MRDDLPAEPSPRVTILTFVIVIVALIAGAGLLLATRPQPVKITVNPPLPTVTPLPSATPAPITVYVTGAVGKPESLVTLPIGCRVQDAIEAAGGATADADLERVNLAGLLRDGDQVHVPARGQETALPTPGGGGVVNVNAATADELAALPNVGPTTAERIIQYREANGPFADLEALDAVEGIGPALLEKIRDLVVFE